MWIGLNKKITAVKNVKKCQLSLNPTANTIFSLSTFKPFLDVIAERSQLLIGKFDATVERVPQPTNTTFSPLNIMFCWHVSATSKRYR
jgi:hypothetical protein